MEANQSKLLLGNAVGFYIAAKRIADGGIGMDFPWPPFFANIGYVFELSIKAYILQHGGTELGCHNIGHDLKTAMTKAQKLGLRQPHEEVTALLNKINPYHRDHSFRYMKAMNASTLPAIGQTLAVTKQHLANVAEQLPELLPSQSP